MSITLKAARVNAGLTQKEAGEMIGKSTNTIQSWEAGKTPIDSFSLIKLSEIYKVPLEKIFLPKKSN